MAQSAPPQAEYTYDADLDALVVTVRGTRTYDQARTHFAEVIGRLRDEVTERLLLDLREVRYEFDLEQSVEAFSRIAEQTEGNQIALVLDASQREQGIVMQTAGTFRWNLVRFFHDREAAETWLRETAG